MPVALDITQPAALLVAALALWLTDALLRARELASWRGILLHAVAVLLALALAVWGVPFADYALGALAAIGGLRLLAAIGRLERVTTRGLRLAGMLRALALLVVLVIAARPVCHRTEFTWQKPVLAVLLDCSGSMDMRDPSPAGGALPPRRERVAASVRDARSEIASLAERFDTRILGFQIRTESQTDWGIESPAGLSGVAAALRIAGELRSAALEAPSAVVLISDGAETVADAAAVRAVAADLAARRIPLLIAGVGPIGDSSPQVEFASLVAPPVVRVRDALRASVAFRVQGCRDQTLGLEFLWNDDRAESLEIPVAQASARIERSAELVPPGPGAHRLTARVTLPPALGGAAFSESVVIEVTDERIRVLLVERVPQTESAFIARALSGDERFEITRWFLFDARAATRRDLDPGAWNGLDVVILGRVGADLPRAALDTLAQVVERRRVGVALVGGRELLGEPQYRESALALLSPVALNPQPPRAERETPFEPTAEGRRHPTLAGLAGFDALPSLATTVVLGEPKPATTLLAQTSAGDPLLAVQSYGGGRTLVAAWESTWPWSLASDAGVELHKRFWRQLVAWLANRQPQAWVIADQSEYPLAALVAGDRHARISAGLSGGDITPAATRSLRSQVAIRPAASADDAWQTLATRASDRGWVAEWPPAGGAGDVAAGDYELRVQFEGGGLADVLSATTRLRVLAEDLERRPPTSNLALLRELAEQCSSFGGRYVDIAELPALLEPLAAEDRRRRVASVQRDDLVATRPWVLVALAVGALSLEWVIRRRAGGV